MRPRGAILRKLTDELRAGPKGGVTAESLGPPPSERPAAPEGVALPVEPPPTEPSGVSRRPRHPTPY